MSRLPTPTDLLRRALPTTRACDRFLTVALRTALVLAVCAFIAALFSCGILKAQTAALPAPLFIRCKLSDLIRAVRAQTQTPKPQQ